MKKLPRFQVLVKNLLCLAFSVLSQLQPENEKTHLQPQNENVVLAPIPARKWKTKNNPIAARKWKNERFKKQRYYSQETKKQLRPNCSQKTRNLSFLQKRAQSKVFCLP